MFRGKDLPGLQDLYAQGQLSLEGSLVDLQVPQNRAQLRTQAYQTDWVVYAKRPFGGPEQVLKYLARYTHRVAISNQRLVKVEEDQVYFRWKDYTHGNAQKVMALEAVEFLRRFLLHVVASGFVRIRHYGLLANRNRQDNLKRCRVFLGVAPEAAVPEDTPEEKETKDKAPVVVRCPVCGQGRMVIVAEWKPPCDGTNMEVLAALVEADTS